MKYHVNVILWPIVLACLVWGTPVQASMSPGHLYAAVEIYKQMPSRLQDCVRRNFNAYLLGSQGHDLAYWAPKSYLVRFLNSPTGIIDEIKSPTRMYYMNKPGAFLHEDGKTGQLIIKMLEIITEKDRLYGGYPSMYDPRMAFTLGWISHYVVDTYIHTLVERYGGVYTTSKGKSRHVQLELVETKHLASTHRIPRVHFSPDKKVFSFLSRALAGVHPGDNAYKGKYGRGRIVSDGGLIPKYTISHDYIPADFVEMLSHGCLIMNDAMDCLRDSCYTGENDCNAYAKFGWLWVMGTDLVSTQCYQRLMEPIDIKMENKSDRILAHITVNDYGLYGKFCVDWNRVMAQAIARNTRMLRILDTAFDNFKGRQKTYDPTPPLPGSITALFPDINILSPEQTADLLPDDIKAYYDDTQRGDFFPIKELFYEYELGKRTDKGKVTLKHETMEETPDKADNLFHGLPPYSSKAASQVEQGVASIPGFLPQTSSSKKTLPWPGTAEIEILLKEGDPPPEDLVLRVSLTDEKPFDHPLAAGKPLFLGTEFVEEKGNISLALRLPGAVTDAFAGTSYAFKAGVPASALPQKPLYVWRFSDTGEQRTDNPTITHYYNSPGQYYVAVFLYDKKSGNRLGAGSTIVMVNDAALSKEERAQIRQMHSQREAQYIEIINSHPGNDLEEKFQSYARSQAMQVSKGSVDPQDFDAIFVHIMEQARARYREEQGEEMPLAMEKIYGNAVRQQIDLFKKANQEPPLNLYKREKK